MNIQQENLRDLGFELLPKIKTATTYITTWGWEGTVTSIDESDFKHGQGVGIIRISDGAKFFIHPTDIKL